MKKKIYIRTDGDAQIGLGHLVRCMALGRMLYENFNIQFVCKFVPESIIQEIEIAGFSYAKIKEEEEFLSSLNFNDIVILDHYNLDSNFQKTIKKIGCKLICVDDLHDKEFWADLIINHAPGIKESDYQAQPYTQFALGTNYAMLRPAFLEAAKEKRILNKIDTAFVCFGGADPYDLTLKVAKALLNVRQLKEIIIVLGDAYNHQDIHKIEKENENVNLYRNLDEFALVKLMYRCHIGIVPSSTILYELCAVKMIVFSGYFVDNQIYIYKALSEKGVIAKGGDFRKYSEDDFYKGVIKTLNEANLKHYLQEQGKLIDGKSPNRFLKLLLNLDITFRQATEGDMMLVYNWSNDVLVRENSYKSDQISLESHKEWYSKRIRDKKSFFLIALLNDEPAGIVRYWIEDKNAVVGILVAENFRRRKLAPLFLKKSAELFFKKSDLPILAYIKEVNNTSIRTFEKAGYSLYKEQVINKINSFVYKLEKNDLR